MSDVLPTVGALVSLRQGLGMVVKVSSANPSGGTHHWQTVGSNNLTYYVWVASGKLVGPVFSSEMKLQ